jgi:hypothetical protein
VPTHDRAAPATAALDAAALTTTASADPVASPVLPTDAPPAMAMPVSAPAASVTPPSGTAPSPPAQQVAQAVVHLAASPSGSQITVQLNPESLGRVQVQIDRTSAGLAHITLTADRPETLALLQGDQRQLDAALTRSGLAELGRTFAFHAATPVAEAVPNDMASSPQTGLAGSAAGFTGTDSGASAMPERQGSRGGPGETFLWTAQSSDTPEPGAQTPSPTPSRQRLDITA